MMGEGAVLRGVLRYSATDHFGYDDPALRIDISGYSQAKLNAMARQLNERPRKTLGYQTPAQMFSQIVASTG